MNACATATDLSRILESETFKCDMTYGFTNKLSEDGRIFEFNFRNLLLSSGFAELTKDDIPDIKKLRSHILNETNDVCKLKNGTFIAEPFGSQSFPDFLVACNDTIIPVELKVTKNGTPMWNNSLPRQHSIYIFLANNVKNKQSELVMFMGRDVISSELSSKLKTVGKSIQKMIELPVMTIDRILDKFNRGWGLYIRVNFTQRNYTDNVQVDYTKHPDRFRNELAVINYLTML
jgi:hypothetical protein